MKSLFVAALSALLLASTVLAAGPQYIVVDLGALPGGGTSVATHINNAGQVTGYGDTAVSSAHAFLYSAGIMQDLGTLDGSSGSSSYGYGINDAGQVAGYSSIPGDPYTHHAVLFSGGTVQDLGELPGGIQNGGESHGFAINDAGQVTGVSGFRYPHLSGDHAFVSSGGTMVDCGSLDLANDGVFGSVGFAINISGVVTGWSGVSGTGFRHAFLSAAGGISDLGTLGGDESIGLGINDAGQVAGWSEINPGDSSDYRHAFLSTGGAMTDLGTLPGYTFSDGTAINNAGQVVGSSGTNGFGGVEHAILYSDGAMYDLNDLVTNLASTGLKSLTVANGINDDGWIVGYGTFSNTYHAFLAYPATPPGMHIVTGGSGFELHWPSVANEWILQTSTTLAAGSWTAIPGPYATSNADHVYSVGQINTGRFFRLSIEILVAGH